MNLHDACTESSWRYEWRTPEGHEVALRFIPSREVWERLMRSADRARLRVATASLAEYRPKHRQQFTKVVPCPRVSRNRPRRIARGTPDDHYSAIG